VIDDIGQLIIEQPGVEGMDDAAHTGRAEPCGEVAAMVHRQRRDPVPFAYAQPFERLCHAPRIMGDFDPIDPDDAVGPGRDDFAVAMLSLSVIDQLLDPERPVLHRPQSFHASSPHAVPYPSMATMPGKCRKTSGNVRS
jgi:hypothetical protein